MILLATSKYGAGLTLDSVDYISAARNLAYNRELVRYNGEQFLHWPPLFPFLLSLFELCGVHAFVGVRFLNAFLFAGIVFMFGILFWRSTKTPSKFLLTYSVFVITTSVPIIQTAMIAWSEPLFIFLVTLFFLVFGRFLETKKPFLFYSSIAIAALIPMARYLGVVVPLIGSIILLASPSEVDLRKRIKSALVFGSISCLPVFFWLMRNKIISSTFTGERSPTNISIWQNIRDVMMRVGYWFTPIEVKQAGLFGIFSMILSFILIFGFLNRRRLKSYYLLVSSLFALSYSVLLVVMNSITHNDRIVLNDRLLSPLYIPLIFAVLSIISLLFTKNEASPKKWMKGLRISFIAFATLSFVLLCFDTGRFIRKQMWRGVNAPLGNSYTKADFQEDPIVKWFQSNRFEGQYYSNFPHLCYAFTWKNTNLIPRNDAEAEDFLSQIEEGKNYLFVIFLFKRFQVERDNLRFLEKFLFEHFDFRVLSHSPMGVVMVCSLKDS